MRRLPGVRIVDEPSPPGDGLPVMDVPVFVGFAERGPLDRPVALEDPVQYAAVFGGALDLVPVAHGATDGGKGDARPPGAAPLMQGAHLPAAVASFFAGGGRRCYVVRVAGAGADSARFAVPKLKLATRERDATGHAGPWRLADQDFELRANSPGAWADRYELAARLAGEILHAHDRVQPGDVLQARKSAEALIGWLRIDSAGTMEEAIANASDSAWLWIPDSASPFSSPSPPEPMLPVTVADWLIDRVTLDLALRHPEQPERRRERCGLAGGAANLPWLELDATGRFDVGDDLVDLSWPLAGPPDPAQSGFGLASSTTDPSKPFDPAASPDWMLVPSGVDASFKEWSKARTGYGDALARNGLATYSAGLFLDPAWTEGLWGRQLLGWADDIRFLGDRPRRLRGLHAALGFDDAVARDATWLAVPDATHPGWMIVKPPAAPTKGRLTATPDCVCPGERATAIGPCEKPRRRPEPPVLTFSDLRLMRVDAVNELVTNGHDLTVVALVGSDLHVRIFDADGKRVVDKAEKDLIGGKTLTTLKKQWNLPPDESLLSQERIIQDATSIAGHTLRVPADVNWFIDANADVDSPPSPPGGDRPAPISFEAQIAQRPDFSDARPLTVLAGTADTSKVPDSQGKPVRPQPGPCVFPPARYQLRLPSGPYFLRARTWRSDLVSDWSATAKVLSIADSRVLAAGPASNAVVLPVHRALMDLCAATREHFALLSVPLDWDATRLAAHVADLRAHAARDIEAAQATSFIALYHPWLLQREADTSLQAHPPEGAVLGVYAKRSRDKGAWSAAGLEPLAETVGLATVIDPEAIEGASANAIELRPRGIAATRAATLSEDQDWTAIGVRRLFILLRRLARREGERYAFEPNDFTLRRSLERSFDALLQRLMQRGAFRGASARDSYALRTASGARAIEEIDRGECSLEIRVAPSRPLRFLTLRVVRAGEQLLIEER